MGEQLQFPFSLKDPEGERAAGAPGDDLLQALGEEQLSIDFSADHAAEGLKRWKEERLERLRRIANLWKLPLGKRVRVELIARAEQPEGILVLARAPDSLVNVRAPLELRVGATRFSSHEISSLVRLD